MSIIKPRLNDYFNIPFTQDEVDFAIPYLDEDIPLYVDPFLLWKSPSLQDNSLHTAIVNSFNHLGNSYKKGEKQYSLDILISASECNEVGLGNSKNRIGKKIGQHTAISILELFNDIPQINKSGFTHFEEIQLIVDNVASDRISDLTCTFVKSFLIDYTIHQSDKLNIPRTKTNIKDVYNYKNHRLESEQVELPINPINNKPLLFIPKRWLRFIPWLNLENYSTDYLSKIDIEFESKRFSRVELLDYNRKNYDMVLSYIKNRELTQTDCKNDPLFNSLPVLSTKRKLQTILKLPTGKEDNADNKYEDVLCPLLASLLYPQLDFAQEQSRTDSGTTIRDLIFYNNRSFIFLKDIYDEFDCRQIVFELKNVKELSREHINQLNRYLSSSFGRFGIIFTRNRPPKKILRNTIDLWSGSRKCILILSDDELKLMCDIYETKQRLPLEVIKMKFVEFTRLCPS